MSFAWPSANLLAQSILSGAFVGALYGLMGLGLGLSWGLLRLINLAYFAFAFLAAYLCYQLVTSLGIDPLLTLLIVVPLFFAIGAALHWLMARFKLTPFGSLLLTFGLTGIVESVIQSIWTADFRKLESHYGQEKFRIGGLFVPVPELITFVLARNTQCVFSEKLGKRIRRVRAFGYCQEPLLEARNAMLGESSYPAPIHLEHRE